MSFGSIKLLWFIDNFLLPFFYFCKSYIINTALCISPLVLLSLPFNFLCHSFVQFSAEFPQFYLPIQILRFCSSIKFFIYFYFLNLDFYSLLLLFHRFHDIFSFYWGVIDKKKSKGFTVFDVIILCVYIGKGFLHRVSSHIHMIASFNSLRWIIDFYFVFFGY